MILCEVNDIGDQVASIIYYDMEYENLLMTSMRGRAGQVLGQGFSGGKTQLGLKMAASPKKIGTSNLKQMVESDKVNIVDFNIINELTTFIERRNSFAAEDGCHDDMVMCMVIYAWAVAQNYFKEMTDQSIRKELYEKDKDSLEEDMSPFGFVTMELAVLISSLPTEKCGHPVVNMVPQWVTGSGVKQTLTGGKRVRNKIPDTPRDLANICALKSRRKLIP